MALTTIDFKPGTLIDRKFILNQTGKRGVLASMASPTKLGITGREMQYVEFEGEAGVFSEDYPDAAPEEKVKGSGTAQTHRQPVYPVTYYVAQRVSKRFLEITTGNGYNMPTGLYYQAGDPKATINQLLKQPYQAEILDQFRFYVNSTISKALDFSGIYGVNPKTGLASNVVRNNGFLLNTAGTDASAKIGFQDWARPATPENGKTPAGNVFKKTVRDIADNLGDYSVQGLITSSYEGDIADEQTTIGSPAQLSGNLPLAATNVTIGGVPLTLSNILPDQNLATTAGVPAGKKVDAIIGDFNDRFMWDAIPLGGIEVFDTGNPDNNPEGDLSAVNKVLLRVEVSMAWGFIGGTSMFRAITHSDGGSSTRSADKN